MQLNMTTDYAVRIMMCLAQTEKRMSASDLSEHMDIPRPYVAKIMVSLKSRGWLNVTGGVLGGYVLAVPPESITLRQIFEAMSDDLVMCRCMEQADFCNWTGAQDCPLRSAYCVIQAQLRGMLEHITLRSLIESDGSAIEELKSLLPPEDEMGRGE